MLSILGKDFIELRHQNKVLILKVLEKKEAIVLLESECQNIKLCFEH